MKKLTKLCEEKISEAYKKFREWQKNEKSGWKGPSLYFHQKTIEYIKNKKKERNFSYSSLLNNTKFLEYLYATLATWGLHRMGGVHIKDFKDFKNEVKKIISGLEEIKDITLKDRKKIKEHEDTIKKIFTTPKITSAETILVSNSKLLHHLHPDLFMPIDREHVLKYLYCTDYPTKGGEEEIFIEILKEYSKFYKKTGV